MHDQTKLVVVDYGVGNVRSVASMLLHLGYRASVTSNPELVASADRIFLPGVGAWDSAVRNLGSTGLVEALEVAVMRRAVPTLGLCLGMQLLFESGAEGVLPGLGFLPGSVERIDDKPGLRIPHMGWNDVAITQDHAIWDRRHQDLEYCDLEITSQFYFVHSFHAACGEELVLGTTVHGAEFPSVVGRDNIVGAQFHPEKSHRYGMRFFANFMEFRP